MSETITLGDVSIEVVRKHIKNLHLSVYPSDGKVRISAPLRLEADAIRLFALTKLGWIKRQQRKIRGQDRETEREYLERESHYVWGTRYLLTVRELDQPPSVELEHSRLVLHVRPGTDAAKRQAVVEGWYRGLLREAVPPLIAKWEPLLGVRVEQFHVRQMKTKWGSCNPDAARILLNTELAKKPKECLEYVVLHEMVHLLVPTHSAPFAAIMDKLMPDWRIRRDHLNRLPVRHETWDH